MISLLDTDFYKLTMAQAVYHQYPDAVVEYKLFDRTKVSFPDKFDQIFSKKISLLSKIKLTSSEKKYLETHTSPYLKQDFIDWLADYSFDPKELSIMQKDGRLSIVIKGSWLRTILWETPLLALINELYYEMKHLKPTIDWEKNTEEKAKIFEEKFIHFVDFGTRRRFSKKVHETVIKILKDHAPYTFLGTSNVHLAHTYDLKPIGTFAHEWVMAHAGLYTIQLSNQKALEAWLAEYKGNLSVAVTDTYTTKKFLKAFNKNIATAYHGVRHDSGDPLKFIDTIVKHYLSNDIYPDDKIVVFSNNLSIKEVLQISQYGKDKIKPIFGIGGTLTNDVGLPRFDIVIKMTQINGKKVYKISDDPYKSTK